MSKRLQVRRHTDKNGDEASEAGLKRFEDEILVTDPEGITDAFVGSLCSRTGQTLAGAMGANGIRAHVHEADKRFGSSEMFNGWKAKGLLEKVKTAGSLYAALRMILSTPELMTVESDLRAATEGAFEKIEDDGHGLLFHHSPLVEMTAKIFGYPDAATLKLASCEGIMLEQDDEGNITVTEILIAT
ncbi:MAG: hypothetical protein PHZ04_04870 [Patescibacteria group bacterium]|nr:hypothetical protein [Patescibacteria group bacterium]MDD5294929.1 hypothetical protein [Patescibacteria group bacterium]MDD5554316.1 hypothetical protein [Patescibacteria group bacterium]